MKRVILIAVATVALVGSGIPVFANGGKGGPPRPHPAFGKDHPVFGKDGNRGGRGAPWMRGARGQHAMKPGGPCGFGHGRVRKELGLTDEQKAKIKELAKQLREKHKGDREAFRNELRGKMQQFLNAEQKAKLEQLMQRRQQKPGGDKDKEAPAKPQQPQRQRQQNFGPRR
jgi:Spy/CpxP family protein refolding chaperone